MAKKKFTGSNVYFQDKFDEYDFGTRYNMMSPKEGWDQMIQDYINSTKMEEGELGKLPPIPLSVLRSGLGYILKQLAGGKFNEGRRDFLEKIVKPKEKIKLDNPKEFKFDFKGIDELKKKLLNKIYMNKNRTLHQEGGLAGMLGEPRSGYEGGGVGLGTERWDLVKKLYKEYKKTGGTKTLEEFGSDVLFQIDRQEGPYFREGGRIGMQGGGWPGMLLWLAKQGPKAWKWINKPGNNPIGLYKNYLKSVKDRTLKANETGKFTDLPLETLAIGAAGGLGTRAVGKKLKGMNEEIEQKNKEAIFNEISTDLKEEYKDDQKTLEKLLLKLHDNIYMEEKAKAEGGRIGLAEGDTPSQAWMRNNFFESGYDDKGVITLDDYINGGQGWRDYMEYGPGKAEGGRIGYDNGGPVSDEEKYELYKQEKEGEGEEPMDFDMWKQFQLFDWGKAEGGVVSLKNGGLLEKYKKVAPKGSWTRGLTDMEITYELYNLLEPYMSLFMKEGGRVGFKEGKGMTRRTFLKLMGAGAALPVIGKFFKLAKPAAKAMDDIKINLRGDGDWEQDIDGIWSGNNWVNYSFEALTDKGKQILAKLSKGKNASLVDQGDGVYFPGKTVKSKAGNYLTDEADYAVDAVDSIKKAKGNISLNTQVGNKVKGAKPEKYKDMDLGYSTKTYGSKEITKKNILNEADDLWVGDYGGYRNKGFYDENVEDIIDIITKKAEGGRIGFQTGGPPISAGGIAGMLGERIGLFDGGPPGVHGRKTGGGYSDKERHERRQTVDVPRGGEGPPSILSRPTTPTPPPVTRGEGPPSILNRPPKGRRTTGGIRDSRWDRWKQHAEFTQNMKLANLKNYHQLGGYDFMNRFNVNPTVAKTLGYGYQGISEGLRGLGKYLTGDPGALSDAYNTFLEEGRLNALGIDEFGKSNSSVGKEYDRLSSSGYGYDPNKKNGGRIGLDNGGTPGTQKDFDEFMNNKRLHEQHYNLEELMKEYKWWYKNKYQSPETIEVAKGGRIDLQTGGPPITLQRPMFNQGGLTKTVPPSRGPNPQGLPSALYNGIMRARSY